MWCHSRAWAAGSPHGQRWSEWHPVLGREGRKTWAPLCVWHPGWKHFLCLLRWISGTVQALKELTVIWIWHCPLPSPTISWKVCWWYHRISSWPLCSFHSKRGPTAFFLLLPHPRCSFYSLQLWSCPVEKLHNLGCYEVIHSSVFSLPNPQNKRLLFLGFLSAWRMLGQRWTNQNGTWVIRRQLHHG